MSKIFNIVSEKIQTITARNRVEFQLPNVEIDHTLQYGWGDIRVSSAAAEAYGLVIEDQPRAALEDAPEELYLPPPPVTVWVLSPDENLNYLDASGDQRFPETSIAIVHDRRGVHLIAGLDQSRFAASQDALSEFSRSLREAVEADEHEVVDEQYVLQGVFIGPEGEVSAEDMMNTLAQMKLRQTLCLMIDRAVATYYEDFAKTRREKTLMRTMASVGMLSVGGAGLQLKLPELLYDTKIGDMQLIGAGANLLIGFVVGRRMLRNFFEYRLSREHAIAQSAQALGVTVGTALFKAHKSPRPTTG